MHCPAWDDAFVSGNFDVFTRATLASAVLAIERWLAGWLAVTHRYCVYLNLS